jgi:NAD(P)-dependent dehydrogenase (short-subunit alcohol dehydrogenase family)
MHVAHTVDEVLSGVDLTGKIFVITGATSGLGLTAARGLASAGALPYATDPLRAERLWTISELLCRSPVSGSST